MLRATEARSAKGGSTMGPELARVQLPHEPVPEFERDLRKIQGLAPSHCFALAVRDLVAAIDEERQFAPNSLVVGVEEVFELVCGGWIKFSERLGDSVWVWI